MIKEQCNTGRQLNIDVAKCSSIVFMVLIHVLMIFGINTETGWGYFAGTVLGGFMSAPVFMVCMGVGLAYSKNHDPRRTVLRGVNILLIGYILNILRALPLMISFLSAKSLPLIESLPLIGNVPLFVYSIVVGDILQFAGLALIAFGILRLVKLEDTTILALGILFSLITTITPVLKSQSLFVNAFVGLFVIVTPGGRPIADFPSISWFIFVAFGYWFGNRLKTVKNLNRFYLLLGIPCFLICLIGVLYEYHHGINMMKNALNYFHMILPDTILSICYCLSCFSFLHFCCKIFSEKLKNLCMTVSNALNIVYLIHWVLLSCLVVIITKRPLSLCTVFGIALGVLIVSSWLGVKCKEAIHNHREKFQKSFLRYL